ncbi:MAG: carboxypeptidase regulatory-like domain-containing protein [Gemmatimonadota bacterium]|nr:carboxypeptidase regulatory-like domain-containing protein [Gemmatimonadota bacterium]
MNTAPASPRRMAAAAAIVAGLAMPGAGHAQRATLGSCPTGDAGTVQVGFEGVVIDDESEVGLPAAVVRLRYEEADGLPDLEDVTTTTDDQGRYRFCGLEAFRRARVSATYLLRRGDEERVDLERPESVELKIDLGDPAFIVFTVADQGTGQPVEGATVDLSPIPVGGITNEHGRVAFRAIPPGDYELTVRHIGYAERVEPISLDEEQLAEMRIELQTQAIALEPIEVQVTGRDPYLLTNGFYERKLSMEGYFGTYEEIRTYTDIRTLFRFRRELSIRYSRNRFVLLNGRPMSRLGFDTVGELSELPFSRVRGVEAYSCSDAPDELMIQIRADVPIGDCNLIAIWTR